MTEPAIRLTAPDAAASFSVDTGKRTISGLAVPYGVVASSGGDRWQFARGSLAYGDVSRVKLWVNHDAAQAVGVATALDDHDDGLHASFRVAPTAEGDHALAMAAAGVWDGLSVGIAPGGKFNQAEDGVFHAVSAPLLEVSLTPAPAFDDARVHAVAASAAATTKENRMTEQDTTAGPQMAAGDPIAGTIAGTVTITPDAPADDSTLSVESSAAPADVAAAVREALAQFGISAPSGRPVIPAGRPTATTQVREEEPYRFDGTRGAHEFSSDLAAALGLGGLNPVPNPEAYTRVMRFMANKLDPRHLSELAPTFVTTTDTAAVNPAGYRPDMFVNEQRLATPLYDAFYKGSLTDATPFTFAKFTAASGLVGDHTEGVEPTAGNYSTAQGATITPAAVSGKVHITREVGDQGGNPQISQLLWDKITYEYRKAMETKVAAILAAASPAEFTATALAVGANTIDTLATPIEQAIMRLNFIAGGNRFNYAPTHLDLYLALGGLKDDQGRPYYPIIGPSNANGSTSAGYPSLNVSGTRFDPAWSLGTTSDGSAHKSYLADTSALYFWASAPTQLNKLQEKVEGWDIGVWGYQAGVLADPTGLLKITYDPTSA